MNSGMSNDMYNFITDNLNRLNYHIPNGIIITSKGNNGTVCSSTGYLRVKVNNKTLQVHQILAVLYFGEKCIGKQINHIDGDKLNNKVSNLEPVTQEENLKHQQENKMFGNRKFSNTIKVDKLDLNGNYIESYFSISEACKDNKIKSNCNITDAIKGFDYRGIKVGTSGGFKWRYSV